MVIKWRLIFIYMLILMVVQFSNGFLTNSANWLRLGRISHQQSTNYCQKYVGYCKRLKIFTLKFDFNDDVLDDPAIADPETLEWERVYAALQAYSRNFGNVRVDSKFEIHKEDFSWPEQVRGIRLGLQVVAIQCGRYVTNHPERRTLLDQLGFIWEPVENAYSDAVKLIQPSYFNLTLTALNLYKDHIDHTLKVNSTYLIPPEPPWPSELFFFPLGNVCSKIRESKEILEVLSPSKVDQLELVGFKWKRKWEILNEMEFNRIFTALCEYKRKYGHMRVPKLFIVPTNSSEWSESVWGMKLGSRVQSLRIVGSYTLGKPERRALLTEAGFDWAPQTREADFRRSHFKYTRRRHDSEAQKGLAEEDGRSVVTEDPSIVDEFIENKWLKPDMHQLDGENTNLYNVPYSIDRQSRPSKFKPNKNAYEAMMVQKEEERTMDKVHPFRKQIIAWEEEKLYPDDPESVKKSEYNMFAKHENMYRREQRADALIEEWGHRHDDPYVVPSTEVPYWLSEDVNYHLREQKSNDVIDKLYEVKHQLLDFGRHWWPDVVDAMTIYRRNFGHLSIPPAFVITEEILELNIGFNMTHYGMELGSIRAQLRAGDIDGYDDPVRRPILDALGFDWGDMRHHLRFRYPAVVQFMLFRYYHALYDWIPIDYVVPDDGLAPEWMVGAPLGEWIQVVRMQRRILEIFYPERIKVLNMFLDEANTRPGLWRNVRYFQWTLPTPDWLREKYEGAHPVPEVTDDNLPSFEYIKELKRGTFTIGKIDSQTKVNNEWYSM